MKVLRREIVSGCCAVALVIGILAAGQARGSIIAQESFVYGSTGGSIDGKNGGTGLSGPWASPAIGYDYPSLTCGSLLTSGGRLETTASSQYFTGERPFNAAAASAFTGTVYGAFLVKKTLEETTGAAINLGQSGDAVTGFGPTPSFAFYSRHPNFTTPNHHAGLTLENEGILSSGNPINLGVTYLYLFKISNGAQPSAALWILTANQYDNFISGGLDEAELNTASLGGGNAEVYDRLSYNRDSGVDPITYLGVLAPFSGVAYDEFRFSDSSLTEAAPPVPEPASLSMLALGAMVFTRRRRQSA